MKRSRFLSGKLPRPFKVWCVECGARCEGGEEIVLCDKCKGIPRSNESFETWRREAARNTDYFFSEERYLGRMPNRVDIPIMPERNVLTRAEIEERTRQVTAPWRGNPDDYTF